MTTAQIINSIRDCSKHLNELNLLRSFLNPALLSPNKEFNKICLNKESSYEEIYLAGLEKQYYNIILDDYSYLQFNYKEEENKKEGINTPYVRYAFYPNPFENFNNDLTELYSWFNEGDISFEDYSQAYTEAKPLIKKVFIRYDFSCEQYKKIYHPTAHFHFGINENTRIPTDKLFCPFSFTLFIINTYYVDNLIERSDIDYKLEHTYKSKFQSLTKVNSFNNKDIDYYCELQRELINLK